MRQRRRFGVFLNNERITPQQLVFPLREFVRQQIPFGTKYVLCAVDWSHLNYAHHVSKTDKTQLSPKTDIGYDLTAMLAVDATFGKPMGLIQAHLKTAYGFETAIRRLLPLRRILSKLRR